MSYDITVVEGPVSTRVYKTEANSTVIEPGKPVKIGGTGNNYALLLATGDPETGTDRMIGISAGTSTQTASADGEVLVYEVVPGQTVMRCKVTTAANADTSAEQLALLNDSVTFDVSGTTFTVDEDEGDDPNVHGLMLVGFEVVDSSTVYALFKLNTGASAQGLV